MTRSSGMLITYWKVGGCKYERCHDFNILVRCHDFWTSEVFLEQTVTRNTCFEQWNLHKFSHQTRGLNQDAHNITHSIGSSPLLDPNSPWRFWDLVTDKTPHRIPGDSITVTKLYPLVGGRWRPLKGIFPYHFTLFYLAAKYENHPPQTVAENRT